MCKNCFHFYASFSQMEVNSEQHGLSCQAPYTFPDFRLRKIIAQSSLFKLFGSVFCQLVYAEVSFVSSHVQSPSLSRSLNPIQLVIPETCLVDRLIKLFSDLLLMVTRCPPSSEHALLASCHIITFSMKH